METIDNVCKELQLQRFTQIPLVQQASEKTGQKAEHLLLAALSVLAIFVIFTSPGRSLLTSLLFVFYPAYKSFNALATQDYSDDKRWLTYWVVLGFFYSFDGVTELLLGWLWGYGLLKFAVLVWVMHPEYKGYQVVYDNVLRPLLDRYDEHIDQYINRAEKELQKKLNQAKDYAADTVADSFFKEE